MFDYVRRLNASEGQTVWTPDSGYWSNEESKVPPWRTIGNANGQDALFVLNLNSHDLESSCFLGGRGFFVRLHSKFIFILSVNIFQIRFTFLYKRIYDRNKGSP